MVIFHCFFVLFIVFLYKLVDAVPPSYFLRNQKYVLTYVNLNAIIKMEKVN